MNDCIFCKIATGEIPSKKIAENDVAIAILDIAPVSAGHTLIIPKQHFDNFSETDPYVLAKVSELAQQVAKKLYSLNLDMKGFNYLSNEHEIAGQVVNHYHFHVIPKYNGYSGFSFQALSHEDPKEQDKIYRLFCEKES